MVSYVKSKDIPSFCLPKKYTQPFLQALANGTLDVNQLSSMDSPSRRAEFGKVLGEENARAVNTLFEEKLLLKNRQKGMMDWVRQLANVSDPIKKNLEDQIMSMDRILNPASQQAFLADLARKKLGAAVTDAEAKQIFRSAQVASQFKTDSLLDPLNKAKRIRWGRATLDLDDLIESMKPDGRTFVDKAIDATEIPRNTQTGFLHFSSLFVQMVGTVATPEWWRSIKQMGLYFKDPEHYRDFEADVITRPNYNKMVAAKLSLSNLSNKLSDREEAIQSTYVNRLNKWASDKTGGWIPDVFGASSRAFTGSQNFVRVNLFDSMLKAEELRGGDTRLGSKANREIAKLINQFTGREDLGKLASSGPLLNTVFYAARKQLADFQMLNPWEYVKPYESKTVRMQRARLMTGMVLTMGSLLALFRAGGYDVSTNPIDADFLKPVNPKTGEKFEWLDGLPSIVRLYARLITGRMINSKGEESEIAQSYLPWENNTAVGHNVRFDDQGNTVDLGKTTFPTTRAGLISQFVRGKLAPLASIMTDLQVGANAIGQEVGTDLASITKEIRDHTYPIQMKNFLDYYYQNPEDIVDIVPALFAFVGVGVESPLPPQEKQGLNLWGDPVSIYHDPVRTDLDKRLEEIGYKPGFPSDTINGVKLTPDQYKEYIHTAGSLSKQMLSKFFSYSQSRNIPKQIQVGMVKQEIQDARDIASAMIYAKSRGTGNDIPVKSMRQWKENNLGVQE